MDLELSDDQRALQESVTDFLDAQCPITLVRQVVEDGKGAEELWQKMVELDWPALTIDQADGGLGLGFVELAVVAEQLGRTLAPVPFMSTACQFASALRLAGTAEQRRRFLGQLTREGTVGTLAIAEDSGSYDPSRIETEAVADAEGWVMSGEKHFVFDGARADEIVVAAKVRDRPGPRHAERPRIGLFVVPRQSVSTSVMANVDPTRQYATVRLDSVKVGADRALGAVDWAEGVLQTLMEECAVAMSAELVGTCQAMFDIVHSYVGEREQFGVKIGSFQAIKHKLADMYVALESARAVSYFAALCIAEDDARRALAVSMAKAAVGDCQKLVAQQSIQCLGGIGYTWEHDIHLFVKRAKASAALFGGATEHRERVAQALGLGAEAVEDHASGGHGR